jgi:hypothetical protein
MVLHRKNHEIFLYRGFTHVLPEFPKIGGIMEKLLWRQRRFETTEGSYGAFTISLVTCVKSLWIGFQVETAVPSEINRVFNPKAKLYSITIQLIPILGIKVNWRRFGSAPDWNSGKLKLGNKVSK